VLAESTTPPLNRRRQARSDRRKHSRSGRRAIDPQFSRRAIDPQFNWRRLAWLFAGYAIYLSIRALPHTLRQRLFSRTTPTPS